MTTQLSIHSIANAKPFAIYSHRGEPVEVIRTDARRSFVTVKPVDGGKKFRVTRAELIERERKTAKARQQFRAQMRKQKETQFFIFTRA